VNNILTIYNELLELQRLVQKGISVDDVKVESVMQSIRQIHDQGVDNNLFLDDDQKHRRKELYADAIKAMSKYGKQVFRDEMEIRQRIIEHKMK
jgi:hypothetical protein